MVGVGPPLATLWRTMAPCPVAPKEWLTQSEIQTKIQVPAHGYEITERREKVKDHIIIRLRYSFTQSFIYSKMFIEHLRWAGYCANL